MMQCLLPEWPRDLPRVMRPVARLTTPALSAWEYADLLAMQRARDVQARADAVRASAVTGTFAELMYVNTADFGSKNTWTSDASLLVAGPNEQPIIPAMYFFNKQGVNRCITVIAGGVIGSTASPTFTFKLSVSTTAGIATITTALATSAAITGANTGITSRWDMRLDFQCNTIGTGTGNTTLSGGGFITSPLGFVTPFTYGMPDATATWTATIDNSLTYYMNLSAVCSASSGSNAIIVKKLWVYGWN